MKVEQISIFLENKPGGLEEVTRILKDAQINIRTLSLADTTDFGILFLPTEGLYAEVVRRVVRAGVPVMGHIGLTPQAINAIGRDLVETVYQRIGRHGFNAHAAAP